jgi:site-specific recombinase XerD
MRGIELALSAYPAAGAGIELKVHPQMLRHACGYALANKGHDTRAIQGWLGHRSMTSTAEHSLSAQPVQGLLAGLK